MPGDHCQNVSAQGMGLAGTVSSGGVGRGQKGLDVEVPRVDVGAVSPSPEALQRSQHGLRKGTGLG